MQKEEDDVVFDEEVTPADNLKKLREKLKKTVEEKQEYLNGWQRAKADFVNFKRESESREKELLKFGVLSVLDETIPLIDQFDMATESPGWKEAPENFRQGMEGILRGLHKILERNDVTSFDPVGKFFDPVRHEALRGVRVETKGENHRIMRTLQKGYEQNGRIVRPAKVEVGEFQEGLNS